MDDDLDVIADELARMRGALSSLVDNMTEVLAAQRAIRTDITKIRLSLEWGSAESKLWGNVEPDMVTTMQMAAELGIEYVRAYRMITSGKVAAVRKGSAGVYLVPRSEVDRVKNNGTH